MELKKQLRFDLGVMRRNRIVYIILFFEVIFAMFLLLFLNIHNDLRIEILTFLSFVLATCFHLSSTCYIEDKGLIFMINKLVYYPTTKVRFLLSKYILLLCFLIFQLGLDSILLMLKNGMVLSSDGIEEIRIVSFITVTSIVSMGIVLIGIRHEWVLPISVTVFMPIFINVISELLSDSRNLGVLLLLGIILFLSVVFNIFNLVRK